MEMQRIKDETLARLRAIVHFSGEHSRLQTMKNLLTQDDLSIDEMKRWHKNITEEFHNLYPAQAASLPADDAFTQSLHAQDYASYQLRAQ